MSSFDNRIEYDRRLSELAAAQLVLFTPAVVYLTTPLPVDPFDAYAAELGDLPYTTIVSQKPIFSGLGLPTGSAIPTTIPWDHVVMALPAEHWQSFVRWFGSCAYRTPRTGSLRRVRTQELSVTDPAAIYERVPVTAFVVESQRGSFYFEEFAGKGSGLYRPRFDPELRFPELDLFAKAISLGESDPYAFVTRELDVSESTIAGPDGGSV